jgi:hypothetical protein
MLPEQGFKKCADREIFSAHHRLNEQTTILTES